MNPYREHILENALRGTNLCDPSFYGPGFKAFDIDSVLDGDEAVLVKLEFPIGTRYFVEKTARTAKLDLPRIGTTSSRSSDEVAKVETAGLSSRRFLIPYTSALLRTSSRGGMRSMGRTQVFYSFAFEDFLDDYKAIV